MFDLSGCDIYLKLNFMKCMKLNVLWEGVTWEFRKGSMTMTDQSPLLRHSLPMTEHQSETAARTALKINYLIKYQYY